MTERKIYSPWAFTDNEREKAKINHEIYKELKEKAVVVYGNTKITNELLSSKSVVLDYNHGHGHTDYKVLSNPHNLSTLELALVCDGGNLCFGHRSSGDIITIHID